MTTIRTNRAVNTVVKQALETGAPGRISSTEFRAIRETAVDQLERSRSPAATLRSIGASLDRANAQTDNRYLARFSRMLQDIGAAVNQPAPAPASARLNISAVETNISRGTFKAEVTGDGAVVFRGTAVAPGDIKLTVDGRRVTIPLQPDYNSTRGIIEALRDQLPRNDVRVAAHASGKYTVEVWPRGEAPPPDGAPVYSVLKGPGNLRLESGGTLNYKVYKADLRTGDTYTLRVDNETFSVRANSRIKTTDDALYALRGALREKGLDAVIQKYSRYPTTFTIIAGR